MSKTRFCSIRLTNEEREEIREIAKTKGISVAEVFREALQLFFSYEADCNIKRKGGRVK